MSNYTTEEAAALIRVAPKTLENWRVLGKGPKFIKAGGRVLYSASDVLEYLNSNRVCSTSERAAAA